MNCLVTGATGFVGHCLCSALQSKRYKVVAGLRKQKNGPWERAVLLDLEGDAVSPSDIQDISCVFHLAGKAHALSESRQDEREYFRVNVEGTKKLLESSRQAGVRRFVFISSVKVMGEGGQEIQDEQAECLPKTPYGCTKLEAERLVLEGGYVPEPVVLRLSMVYGATRRGNLPRMIEAVSKGIFPPLPEIANARSMVHVEDVVQAAVLAAEQSQAVGQTYIVADGCIYSTRQIYEWICVALGRSVPSWTIPINVLNVLAKLGDSISMISGRRFIFDSDALDKLLGSAVYSSEKIQQQLGFRPKLDLRSTLPDIVAQLGYK